MPYLFILVAFLYASVGHGGASGYLALMAIYGVPAAEMRFSALMLNLLVSAISFYQYYRAGYFRWNLFWPFALASVPASFAGATIVLDGQLYRQILGVVLLLAVARMLYQPKDGAENKTQHIPTALILGALIGFVSGLIGIGGGIILSPLLLLMRWSDLKTTAAVSALFILVNSVSGLCAQYWRLPELPPMDWRLFLYVLVGALGGAYAGARKMNQPMLRYFLAFVLSIAALKLILTA